MKNKIEKKLKELKQRLEQTRILSQHYKPIYNRKCTVCLLKAKILLLENLLK